MDKNNIQSRFPSIHESGAGFTIIELIVSVAIVAVLSTIILFSITQYINKGRDANVFGNLAVLVPAGESYYNVQNSANGTGYQDFCTSTAVVNVYNQLSLPDPIEVCEGGSYSGLCCTESNARDAWMACAQEFSDPRRAFCVDSRGIRRHICVTSCYSGVTECPEDVLSACQ